MKIKLDIDCTPDEVREFFGLPQVKPLQEELLKEVQERLSANIKAMDPEAMLKTWLPATLKGFEQLQEMFLVTRWAARAANENSRGHVAADLATAAALRGATRTSRPSPRCRPILPSWNTWCHCRAGAFRSRPG